MQLLKITTTPIEYEIKIEHAKLEKTSPTENAKINIKTQNAQMRVDSPQKRAGLNMRNNDEFVRKVSNDSLNNAMQKTGEYAQLGKQLSQISNGTKISDIYRNKMINEVVSNAMETIQYVSLGTPDIQWKPPKIDLSYIKGFDSSNYLNAKSNMEYVPGRYHMDIIQLPKVSIEYTGGARYVPSSSDPNYKPEE